MGENLHRGRSFIIQIELCWPIDTFSGGGFSNSRGGRRGSSAARARDVVRATHLHTELNSSILAFYGPSGVGSLNKIEGQDERRACETQTFLWRNDCLGESTRLGNFPLWS